MIADIWLPFCYAEHKWQQYPAQQLRGQLGLSGSQAVYQCTTYQSRSS
jgi:hypothetical protein